MKKYFSLCVMFLIILSSITNVQAISNNAILQEDKTKVLEYNSDNSVKELEVHFNIEDNQDMITINLSDIIKALNDWYNDNTGAKKSLMPGDYISYKIVIDNHTKNSYQYLNNSLKISSAQMNGNNPLNDTYTFDHQILDLQYGGYRSAINKAIYSGIFNQTSSNKVDYKMMLNIYSYLETLGYQGNDSLTNYLLDYYNNSNDFNKDGHFAQSIEELDNVAKKDLVNSLINHNGTYSVSYLNSNRDTIINLLNNTYPQFNNYGVLLSDGNNSIRFRILESEKQLAAFIYNYFYDECLFLNIGSHIINPNTTDYEQSSKYGIKKIYENKDGVLDDMNNYLKKHLSNINNSSNFELEMGLSGPNTGNSYQNFNTSFTGTINLIKIPEYSITINYLLDGSDTKLIDSYHEIQKENYNYDISKHINKTIGGYYQTRISGDLLKGSLDGNKTINVYYLPYLSKLKVNKIDPKGLLLTGATFKLYSKSASKEQLILTKENKSSFTIDDLKDGEYRLYETKAPSGYRINKHYYDLKIIQGKIYYNNQIINELNVVDERITTNIITGDNNNSNLFLITSLLSLLVMTFIYTNKFKL